MMRATGLACFLVLAILNFVYAEEDTCKSLCEGDKPAQYQDLKVLANPKTGIFLVVNSSAGEAVAIDIKNGMIGLLNGKTGYIDIVDKKRNRKVVFNNTKPPYNTTEENFEVLLKTAPSLQGFFFLPGGTHYNLSDVPKPILDAGNKIEVNFIGGPIPGVESDPYAGLKLALKLSEKIIDLFTGPLKGILLFLNGKEINGNIQDFGNTVQAMGKIAEGGFQS